MPEMSASDRPSFTEAFASEAPVADSQPAHVDTPSPETAAAAPASVDAIAPPAETVPTDGITPEPGPLPFKDHKRILDGRTQERDTFKQQLDQLSWAKSVDRGAYEEGARIGQLYQTDKPAFIRQLLAEASQNPELMPLVRSEAARVLGTRSQPPPVEDLEPDIPVMDANGQVVSQTYSADRVQKIVARAVQDAITKEVGPMRQDFQSRQAAEKVAAAQKQVDSYVTDSYSHLVDVLPGFKAHEQAIAKVMETIPGDPIVAAQKAWHQVVGSKLSNASETQAKQLEDLKTRAAASTVNPATAASATHHRPTSFLDDSLSWT